LSNITSKERKALPDSAFALPKKRKYPLDTANRARNALAREHFASPEEQATIKSKVKRRYPNIKVEGEPAKPRADRASRR
jgi:hypothetical protein